MANLFAYISLIFSLLLVLGCEQAPDIQPSGKTIKVGYVGKYDDNDRAQGTSALEGVLAANRNRPLLDNGDEIQIVAVGQGKSAADTLAAIEELVETQRVAAVLIGSASQHVLGIKDQLDAYSTPVLSLIATHPEVPLDTSFVTQLCFDDTVQGTVAATFVRDELLIKRTAVFFDRKDPYSSFLAQTFRTVFETLGGEVTGFHDASHINKELLSQLNELETQLLYIPLNPKQTLELAEGLDGADWNPTVMASDGLIASVISEYPEQLEFIEGYYATDLFASKDEFIQAGSFALQSERLYRKMFSSPPTTYTGLGAEGYELLRQSMNLCGSKDDRACINRNIRQTKNFEGLLSKISITPDGKAIRPVFVNRIRGQKLRSVVKVY
ncbi:MAG: ABC transporter substrate-binding protein [bacterium]